MSSGLGTFRKEMLPRESLSKLVTFKKSYILSFSIGDKKGAVLGHFLGGSRCKAGDPHMYMCDQIWRHAPVTSFPSSRILDVDQLAETQ